MILRQVGEVLGLEAQLSDLDASGSKRIIAELLNIDGTLRGSVELTHVSDGVYVETTEVMPNVDTLLVKYYTYESDGVTLDEDYITVGERYMLEAVIAIGEGLEGSITNAELEASIQDMTIETELTIDSVTGIVNDGDLVEEITV